LKNSKTGLIFGVSAYVLWGLFPLYWPLLEPAGAFEIVGHRAVWSLVFCVIALTLTKAIKPAIATMKRPRVFIKLFAATALISINWIVYIWATNNGHVVEASLGYYINPIIIIAIGVLLLKEKMRKLQWASVSIAAFGVLVLTIDYGRLPWIALALALSWGTYGFIKKQLGLGALEGLGIETAISAPFYLAYLAWIGSQGDGHFTYQPGLTLLLIGSGVVTAIPLLLFNGAGNRLPYTIIGLLQFITPTLQFSIGVWVRHEEMSQARWAGFLIIWTALVVLATDLVRSSRTIDDSVAERK
jgi:chloramphenicol-sensitive protein RarD